LANRVICRLCLHPFEDTSHVSTVDCPVCGAVNEKGRSRRLG
jgi:rubrerythrin